MPETIPFPADISGYHATLHHLSHEPAAVYHARRSEYLSSHALGDFRHCPRLFRDKECGAITDKDCSAYLLGRAVHCRALEGEEAYEEQFTVGGPVNERTGKPYGRDTQAFARWAAAQPGEILSESQDDLAGRMARAVNTHGLARELLSQGIAEGVVRCELLDVPCQIRCDWFNPTRGLIDLKTCDDLDWFERDARRFRYVHQLAFYRAVLHAVSDEVAPVHLIAVEKQRPHRVGVWRVDDAALDLAEDENAVAIDYLKQCREHDEWPTGYESLRVLAA